MQYEVIATVTGVPSQGIANVPDRFSGAGNLFARRFNCTGKAVQVRRVETGVFEIRFAGISGASAVASAVADDAYATVRNGTGGSFIVTMHPSGRDDRSDMAFTMVVA